MVQGENRIPYWIDRRLTDLAGPDYDATISFGLPFELGDCPYGKSRFSVVDVPLGEGSSAVPVIGVYDNPLHGRVPFNNLPHAGREIRCRHCLRDAETNGLQLNRRVACRESGNRFSARRSVSLGCTHSTGFRIASEYSGWRGCPTPSVSPQLTGCS